MWGALGAVSAEAWESLCAPSLCWWPCSVSWCATGDAGSDRRQRGDSAVRPGPGAPSASPCPPAPVPVRSAPPRAATGATEDSRDFRDRGNSWGGILGPPPGGGSRSREERRGAGSPPPPRAPLHRPRGLPPRRRRSPVRCAPRPAPARQWKGCASCPPHFTAATVLPSLLPWFGAVRALCTHWA